MARMIPSFVEPDTPAGERDVFNLFEAGPADWVVLHSLDVSPWNGGRRTEIDFVAIIPELGILCVEVKSHNQIGFDGERWHPPALRRSPFKQVVDASCTFHRSLSELAPNFSRVPVLHCCIFPRAVFDLPPILSIQPWELMDARVFSAFRSATSFSIDLRQRMERGIAADGCLRHLGKRLSQSQVEALVRHCVPVQKRRPDAREEIKRRAEAAEAILRHQQKPVLRLVAENPRVVVTGGAGTGKTLIAMEVARRAADEGRRTALLCFNQLIGNWMKERMAALNPPVSGLVVGRAIRVMADMAEIDIPTAVPREYWDSEFPDMLEARLTEPEFRDSVAFDYLVLDEAQDILARPRLWECLGAFLSSGFERGRFALFGDFSNQVLAERDAMDRNFAALKLAARPANWRLSENCRNYEIIGETAVRLSGISPDTYSGYMRFGGSVRDYEISFYDGRRDQLDRLKSWLREFRGLGYKASDLTILSFRDTDSSAAAELIREGYRLRPVWKGGKSTGFASVSAFKGMENKVVILTDVAPREHGFYRELFYTGMTRATESVRVSCAKDSQDVLMSWLVGGTPP